MTACSPPPLRSLGQSSLGQLSLGRLLAAALPWIALCCLCAPAFAGEQPPPAVVRHTHGSAHHHRHPSAPSHHPHPAAHLPPPVPPVLVPPPAPLPPNVGSNTRLPLPRFVSLRADQVNMRSGPGQRYPIQWVYKRRELPVEIEREFDVWRLVEDSEGVRGWVHQATLVGTRTFVVIAAPQVALRKQPSDNATIVAILRPGVTGRLRLCPSASGWCRVTSHTVGGWLPRSAIFGLLPGEVITPP